MKHRVFNFSLFIIYITAATAFMIWQGIGIAPDRYAFILLLAALFIKKTRSFLLDWIPALFILISYDFLRGFADNLSSRVHFQELIDADIALFGTLPTVYLQQIFYTPGKLSILDIISAILYLLHFALPLSFAFLLWLKNRAYFKYFVTGILILSYAGWVTYLIYPAAPPWLAQEKGLISGVTKILDQALLFFPERLHLPTVYHQFNPNPVAAIPSMHAAYPLLIFLYALRYFKSKALFFLPYVLGVWFSIVYLGEHYALDVIIGAIYALASYMVAMHVLHHVKFFLALVNLLRKLQAISKKILSETTSLF